MDVAHAYEQARAAHQAGQLDQAQARYRAILKQHPEYFAALCGLGFLEAQRGRFEPAIAALTAALRIKPDDTMARTHLGHALLAAGRTQAALEMFDGALAVQPDAVDVLYNRAVILSGMARAKDALVDLDRALALQPGAAMILYNRGVVMTQLGRHVEALANYDRALVLQPELYLARGNRAMSALIVCDWARTAAIATELTQMVQAGLPVAPMTLQGYSQDKAMLRQAAENTLRALVPAVPPPLWTGENYGHDRLRLVYLSADFRDHAVAHQIAPVIERHDRSRFEVIGISLGVDDASETRSRLTGAFDQFHDMQGQDSETIARRIRAMEADILIDLNGHTGGGRPEILAWRPAPMLVNWLGYPGTLGGLADYLIADAIVAPMEHQAFYSEKLLHLPGSFFPADSGRTSGPIPTREQAGLPPDGVVFCCFNNGWKITQDIFAIWMRLLAGCPGSVLWLKDSNSAATANLRAAAQMHGIDPARLIFAGDASESAHLARLALADIVLDTLPYNAHATAADALSAGVPVLSCQGAAFAGRVAASLLHAAGLPELVTHTLADYEAQALRLTQNAPALAALKAKVRASRPALFDADTYTRKFETVLRNTFEQHMLLPGGVS